MAKRIVEMKKELRKTFRKMSKLFELRKTNTNYYSYNYDVDNYCFPKGVTEYTIVTSEGIQYIINALTKEVPDIDFKKIIYVEKYLGGLNYESCDAYDTDRGWYRSRDNYDYFNSHIDTYKIKWSIEIVGVEED